MSQIVLKIHKMELNLLVGIQLKGKETSLIISNRRNIVKGIGYTGDGIAGKAMEGGEAVQDEQQ